MQASELIKEIESRLEELGKQTDVAKRSEEVQGYLRFMSRFHNYSLQNTLSIWYHCPQAANVAGFQTWKKLGRYVRSGEKGIPICAPCAARKKDDDGEDSSAAVTFYKIVYVFDVSQTEGKPLPAAPITTTDGEGVSQALLPLIEELARQCSITVEYVHLEGDHHGTSFGGRIEINDRMDDAGKVSVLIHELAHEALHKGNQREETTRQSREVEAEAISFIVSTYFGLESKAANYLALWDADKEGVMASFKRIQAVAAEFIKAIESMKGGDTVNEDCV